MKTISAFSALVLKTRQRVAKFFWPLLAVAAVFLTAYVITGANPSANARVWYFAGIIAYIIIGGVIISEVNEVNVSGFMGTLIEGLLLINIVAIIILIVGFVLNFFLNLPLTVQAILGWPAIVSLIIFIILTLGIFVVACTIGAAIASDLEYEGY
ncbi:MAG: hypothetical protein Q8N57_01175 [bacterium]|nr:hypothetical protein [bacterium]